MTSNEGGHGMKHILKVENLQKFYKSKGSITKAVDNISFEVEQGEYIGIMGVLWGHPEVEKQPY